MNSRSCKELYGANSLFLVWPGVKTFTLALEKVDFGTRGGGLNFGTHSTVTSMKPVVSCEGTGHSPEKPKDDMAPSDDTQAQLRGGLHL